MHYSTSGCLEMTFRGLYESQVPGCHNAGNFLHVCSCILAPSLGGRTETYRKRVQHWTLLFALETFTFAHHTLHRSSRLVVRIRTSFSLGHQSLFWPGDRASSLKFLRTFLSPYSQMLNRWRAFSNSAVSLLSYRSMSHKHLGKCCQLSEESTKLSAIL
jgi:hypothetical protein